VHPSFADTPMVQKTIANARNPEKMRASLNAASPLGRMGEAVEVARTILFLASDEASFTTGGEFVVDGGATAA
jgi:3(or 17)beta-hydroxysteroid dehydrogenase